MTEHVGRPEGGMKSEAGRAAYWRMQHEAAIGALADLIVEHRELVERIEALANEKAALAAECEAVVAQALAHDPEADYDDLHRNCVDAEDLRADEAALRTALSPADPTKEGRSDG